MLGQIDLKFDEKCFSLLGLRPTDARERSWNCFKTFLYTSESVPELKTKRGLAGNFFYSPLNFTLA